MSESPHAFRCDQLRHPWLLTVATADYFCLEHVLVLEVKVVVKAVETMGLEPTTPCLQKMGRRVQERPHAYTRDGFDAHALPYTAAVATAVATGARGGQTPKTARRSIDR
jgi:hypothetical protein